MWARVRFSQLLRKATGAFGNRSLDKLIAMGDKAAVDVDASSSEPPQKKIVSHLTIPSSVLIHQNAISITQKRREKPKKFAFLLSYCGAGYHGMQINGEFPTIELELFRAFEKLDYIGKYEFENPSSFSFQRAARTDKGVSAVRQIAQAQLSGVDVTKLDSFTAQLNENLPPDIRVMGTKRTTKSFNCKTWCDHRTYCYTLPTFAFAPSTELSTVSYRMPDNVRDKLNDTMAIFCGTHNFWNFTSRKDAHDSSSKRYITEFSCGQPFLAKNGSDQVQSEFATITVKGQSFMLHQIRKMIGLVTAIMRDMVEISVIQRCWEDERIDVPMAPGLGLMLEKVHFHNYDKKFKTHSPLDTWPECEDDVQKFRRDKILQNIIDTEHTETVMLKWLATLPLHHWLGWQECEGNPKDNAPAQDLASMQNWRSAKVNASSMVESEDTGIDGRKRELDDSVDGVIGELHGEKRVRLS